MQAPGSGFSSASWEPASVSDVSNNTYESDMLFMNKGSLRDRRLNPCNSLWRWRNSQLTDRKRKGTFRRVLVLIQKTQEKTGDTYSVELILEVLQSEFIYWCFSIWLNTTQCQNTIFLMKLWFIVGTVGPSSQRPLMTQVWKWGVRGLIRESSSPTWSDWSNSWENEQRYSKSTTV